MRELIAVVGGGGGANSTPSRRASNHEGEGEGKRGGNYGLSFWVHGGIITLLQKSCIGEEARMPLS